MATTKRSGETNPTFKEVGKAFGEVMEATATVMGRGMAAAAEGVGQLADRAADMSGAKGSQPKGTVAARASGTLRGAAKAIRKPLARRRKKTASR